ncbi:MAG: type II toxin-antitoxin system PemK/MazF family toxin [Chitinispirillaceae bacterium]|nr:type II toxin-antitoxin system PemK/MazF family toxin [Chitinispirillaceae bacterium]
MDLRTPRGSEPGFRHPCVVIQNDVFNASNVHTTVVIVLTSNLTRAGIPGNVLLKKGEANLTKASVVNVLQIQTINKSDLLEKIGHLSRSRIDEIITGVHLVTNPRLL